MTIAMHMADGLLSIPVAGATLALAAIIVVLACARARGGTNAEKLPLMGVMGAFVFAGQMINFPLPGMGGTSGHLGGGVLLAIVLGPAAAIVTMTAILTVQCLIFQDGGLLALGCNVINMGVVPCLGGWALYRVLLGAIAKAKPWRRYLAAWLACLVSVTAGAALVPLEAKASGVLLVPVTSFLAVMVGVHVIIGFLEGLITFAVVAYLRQVRPSILGLLAAGGRDRLSRKAVGVSLLASAVVLAGIVSWFASTHEDGLEAGVNRAYGNTAGAVAEPSDSVAGVTAWQAKVALLPDYAKRTVPLGQVPPEAPEHGPAPWPAADGWTSLAGVVGTAVTLVVVYLAAVLVRSRRRRDKPTGAI